MKIQPRGVAGFLRRPDPAVCAVLVHGPDAGLVRERAAVLARTVVDDLGDPFRVSELPAAALAEDPGRFADEMAALALTGGRRVVRVSGAGDRLAALLERFLAAPVGDALAVIEAGELPARSSLRKLFEGAGNAAAIACYGDDPEALEVLVEQVLQEAGLAVEPAAMEYLKGSLGGDRGLSRRELEKLVTYMGDGGGTVRLADVEACVGDSAALALDDIVYAAAGGDAPALERSLTRGLVAGESPVRVLRMMLQHLQRLHLVAGLVGTGIPVEAAVKRLRPPLHFRRESAFRAQARAWTVERLSTAMEIVSEAEMACKSTGSPDQAVCRWALLRICQAGRASRSRP